MRPVDSRSVESPTPGPAAAGSLVPWLRLVSLRRSVLIIDSPWRQACKSGLLPPLPPLAATISQPPKRERIEVTGRQLKRCALQPLAPAGGTSRTRVTTVNSGSRFGCRPSGSRLGCRPTLPVNSGSRLGCHPTLPGAWRLRNRPVPIRRWRGPGRWSPLLVAFVLSTSS